MSLTILIIVGFNHAADVASLLPCIDSLNSSHQKRTGHTRSKALQ